MGQVSSPLCGDYYQSLVPCGKAKGFLILSEDLWNERVSDSVAVPIFESDEPPTQMRPHLIAGLIADCTLIQNVPQDLMGSRLGSCPNEPWIRIRMAVRIHLDIDSRISQTSSPARAATRTDWWPHQNEVRFARSAGIPEDKLFAAITNDQWNSRVNTTYCSAVRLTSKEKSWRSRWEVEVSGGCVVCADIYVLAYETMDQPAPTAPYPDRLSLNESAGIAERQKRVLTLI